MNNRKNRGQFSILAALFVAIILVSSIMFTYSSVRYNTNQSEPQILSAIDETNLALKQVLGFSVGYYGSVLQVTGDTAYAKNLSSHYLDTGLENIADIRPEWGTSIQVNDLSMSTRWFMNSSYSQGTLNVTYALTGLGVSGIAYSASSRLDVDIFPSPSTSQVCLNVTRDGGQPFNDLSLNNFKFYKYQYDNLTWQMVNPPNEPIAFPNGTYLVDIPSGINPYSFVIQVSDTRGINVAASSFSHYTGTLTFNNTVVPSGDYVDNYNSQIDGLADQGTHSNFNAQNSSDGVYDTLTQADVSTLNQIYNASSYSLAGSTTLISGTPANLALTDGSYMTFGGYGTSASGQTLYSHKETTSISGTNYNNFLLTSADSSSATLSASMASSRTLLGKSVYSLQGLSSIPASTWTFNYRAWRDSSSIVTYDNTGSATASASSISWSHNVGSGSNRLLVVTVSTSLGAGGTAPATVSSITYNGVAMTSQITDSYTSNSNPQVRSYIYYLKNPASGSHTIQVTLSASSNVVGGSVSYANVDQTTPIQTQSSSKNYGSSQSVSVTVAGSGRAVYGSLGSYYSSSSHTITDNSGQTHVWGQTSQRYEGHGEDEMNAASGSESVGWTTSRSVGYVACAIVINPSTSSAVGHIDADLVIRKSDNTVRQTVATGVAASGSLATSASTLSGTYSWLAYTVISQTDYLEVDYYVAATVSDSVNAYLMIDNNALALVDQTKISNVMLPSQYTCQVELSGTSNLNTWNNLLWAISASSTVSNVNTVFQLYNYQTGQYPNSGNGYLAATLGTSVTANSQNITVNPAYFRDSIGTWKLRFNATVSSATPFSVNVDSTTFNAGTAIYAARLEEQWTSLNYTAPHPALCIKTGALGAENLVVEVRNGGSWITLSSGLTSNNWNNFSISSYVNSPTFTIRFRGANNGIGDTIQDSWAIDSMLIRPESDQELFTSLQDPSATVAVELLQNGTMRWLGEGLTLTSQTIPIPPVPVKDIHVNETVNGFAAAVPFQIEDWASSYTVPLGLTSNATVFGNRQMIVFLVNTRTSQFTIWWNGTDDAVQTPLAFTNTNFGTDNPSGGTISNGKLRLSFDGSFTVTSTVVATGTSSSSTFMRVNNQASTYGAGLAYVIHHGIVRDVVQQEAEWSNGATNCPNLYSNLVLTLPANATYFTYQLGMMFINSAQTRTITDLCPIKVSSTISGLQTENGTALGDPIVAAGSQTLNSSGIWGHHWSQFFDGTKGAGIMFTNSSNRLLYAFDAFPTANVRGALKADATAQTIQLLPVTLNSVQFTSALNIAWIGAVATSDGTTPIFNTPTQPGLWVLAELPPAVNVQTGN
jgi:hypothetical protein